MAALMLNATGRRGIASEHSGLVIDHLASGSKLRRHECTYCGQRFLSRMDMERHVRIHLGIMPYQCSLCQFKFRVRSNAIRHIKRKHEKYDNTRDFIIDLAADLPTV